MFTKFFHYLVSKITGEASLTFFIIFHLFMPVYNIIRACIKHPFHFRDFGLILVVSFFIFFLFKKKPEFFVKTVKTLFSSSLYKRRLFLSLGPLFLKNYPKFFGFYILLSVSSVYVFKCLPEITWVYPFYLVFTILRNLFILPISGYSFLIGIHQIKISLKQTKKTLTQDFDVPLFENLKKDTLFQSQFYQWCDWIQFIKPTIQSAKTSVKFSFFTGLGWNFFLTLNSNTIKQNFFTIKKTFDRIIPQILEYKMKENDIKTKEKIELFKELSLRMQERIKILVDEFEFYMNSSNFSVGFYYILGDKKLEKLREECYILTHDSIKLEYLFDHIHLNLHNLSELKGLVEEYGPELLNKTNSPCFEIDEKTLVITKIQSSFEENIFHYLKECFSLSRLKFHELASQRLLMGITKSSW